MKLKKFEITFFPPKPIPQIFENEIVYLKSKEEAFKLGEKRAKEKGGRLVDVFEFKDHRQKEASAPTTSSS